MSELPWLRLYTEFATDPQVQILAFEDQRHFVMALCAKQKGILDKTYATPELRVRVISAFLGLDPIACGEANRRLREMGLVGEDWQPANWESRQFPSDSSTDRVRRWRAKSGGNGDGTFQKRYSNGTDLDSESDTDSDSEQETLPTRARASRAGGTDPQRPAGDEASNQFGSGNGHGHPIHDWRRVPGVDRQAFAMWLDHLEGVHKPVSPAAEVSMSKILAATGDAEHQRRLIAFHIDSSWKNLQKLTPERLETKIREREGSDAAGVANTGRRESRNERESREFRDRMEKRRQQEGPVDVPE